MTKNMYQITCTLSDGGAAFAVEPRDGAKASLTTDRRRRPLTFATRRAALDEVTRLRHHFQDTTFSVVPFLARGA